MFATTEPEWPWMYFWAVIVLLIVAAAIYLARAPFAALKRSVRLAPRH